MSPTDFTFCTVLTDASWCPHSKAAGWAAWIVCNETRHKQHAPFKEIVENACVAEIMAIINGVYLAQKKFKPDHYHVVTDCTKAILILKHGYERGKWTKMLTDIIGEANITYKHVKAHTENTDKRSYVNNWCDLHAKRSMRQLREKITGDRVVWLKQS
jgi:RNase H